jgi:hypothetical protein
MTFVQQKQDDKSRMTKTLFQQKNEILCDLSHNEEAKKTETLI